MKPRSTILLAVCLLLAACSMYAQVKKYDIKSGVVTFETTMQVGSMNVISKTVVWFDDYGMKECKDIYSGQKLERSYFSDGQKLYTVVYAQKVATMRGNAYRGTETRYDWNEVSDQDKKEGKARKIANMTVAGKACEAFETGPANGKTTWAGWNHILLYLESTGSTSHTVLKAVKVEENVPVPAEKFVVPAGFTVKASAM